MPWWCYGNELTDHGKSWEIQWVTACEDEFAGFNEEFTRFEENSNREALEDNHVIRKLEKNE